MANLVLYFQTVTHATGYKIEYSDDGKNSFQVSANSPATSSPVIVLSNVSEGVYNVKLTALGDGTNYLDSPPVVSSDIVVDYPAVELESPTIDSVDVEESA